MRYSIFCITSLAKRINHLW